VGPGKFWKSPGFLPVKGNSAANFYKDLLINLKVKVKSSPSLMAHKVVLLGGTTMTATNNDGQIHDGHKR